jgi:hypothetical protein
LLGYFVVLNRFRVLNDEKDKLRQAKMIIRDVLSCVGVATLLLTGASIAQVPEAEPRGVYKRIKAPQPGSRPRVTVQISPEEHAAQPSAPSTGAELVEPEIIARTKVPPASALAPENKPVGSYKAFWNEVSPELAKGSSGRLDDAIKALATTKVATPRLQTLQEIAERRGVDILRSTVGTKV